MTTIGTMLMLYVIGGISIFLSVRWKNKNSKLTGLDHAMGMSKAKATLLMILGVFSLVTATVLLVASMLAVKQKLGY